MTAGASGVGAAMQTAEVIAIGSELLGSTRLDTNSLYLAERLASLGIELRSKTVVGDSRSAVAEHLRRALDRADVVILTGDASANAAAPPAKDHPAYAAKYARSIAEIGMTPESFTQAYSVPVRIRPTSLRGH